ncbi:MAG: hypothetical protein IIY21_03705 [Clostridiales bacterium]|nr:hypothetical protein [Clostridiales bacterium]
MERRAKVQACKDLAVASGRMISMDPDRWGEHQLDAMESELSGFLGRLPEEVRDEYEDRFIAKYREWLGAMSRCFSQMITGAGGWTAATHRRHERTNAAEHAARERLDQWKEKVIKRCNRQERLTGWAEVERLQSKLEDLQKAQEMMKAANKIIRDRKLAEVEKVDELVALGFPEDAALRIMDPKHGWWGAGFAPFELSNNNARIKDTEAKIARHTKMAELEDEKITYHWGEYHRCFSEERYRFVFDGKPEQEVINLLKSEGFKWSPKNKAWQRQMTPNAGRAVRRVLDKLNGTAK